MLPPPLAVPKILPDLGRTILEFQTLVTIPTPPKGPSQSKHDVKNQEKADVETKTDHRKFPATPAPGKPRVSDFSWTLPRLSGTLRPICPTPTLTDHGAAAFGRNGINKFASWQSVLDCRAINCRGEFGHRSAGWPSSPPSHPIVEASARRRGRAEEMRGRRDQRCCRRPRRMIAPMANGERGDIDIEGAMCSTKGDDPR